MKRSKRTCKGMNKAIGYDSCGELVYRFRYGLCRSCFNTWRMTTEQGKENLNKERPNKVSDKTKRLNKTYLVLRETFLNGKRCPVTNERATEIHHTNGREYERLNDVKNWLAVSRKGHRWIHDNPKEAREKGWLK